MNAMAADTPSRPVLVGVDGSGSALHATRWAAAEAGLRNAPLRLVHACFPIPSRYEAVGRQAEPGRLWLREAAAAARAVAPGISIWCDLQSGNPADRLAEESASADLVVAGAWGLGKTGGSFIGPVARSIVTRAACPPIIVRGATVESAPPGSGPVVVGVDDAADGLAALAFAFQEAAKRCCAVVAVRVAEGRDDRRLLDACLAGRTAADVHPVLVEDRHTARALLAAAPDACLVVVGTRRRKRAGQVILGCIGHGVLEHAPCPVAVVPVS